MKKKRFRIFSIILGILLLLFLIVNFGLNFWLKSNLPRYIKNNSEYIITYKTLDIDAGTGNILSTGITINNQNPDRTDKLGLQGTIDSLSISRLGIYDLIFKKNFTTDKLTLKSPNLNIILAKPSEDKTGEKKKLPNFENITITNGNIQIFKSTNEKILAVKELDFMVQDLRIIEKSSDNNFRIMVVSDYVSISRVGGTA